MTNRTLKCGTENSEQGYGPSGRTITLAANPAMTPRRRAEHQLRRFAERNRSLSATEFMHIPYQEPNSSSGTTCERARSAFSLTEALVVITVIAILATFILTGVVAANNRAKQAQCAHNVGQIGVGLQLFATEYQVHPLYVNTAYRQGAYPEHQTAWISALEGILSRADPVKHPGLSNVYQKGIWVCPSGSKPPSFPESRGYNSYGYNAYGLSTRGVSLGLGGHEVWAGGPAGAAPPVKDSDVANPSQLVALGDGFEGDKSAIMDGLFLLRRRNGVQDYLGSTARALARHKKRANIAFCDGHVEAPTLKSLFEDNTDAALARWNRDSQPHRELLSP
jgi:prepilin-type processing-associated H-X9-DG protein